jgi:hypothetical protein
MSAFKAANPGCVLEDFVRWHSPRDWIEVLLSLCVCVFVFVLVAETMFCVWAFVCF